MRRLLVAFAAVLAAAAILVAASPVGSVSSPSSFTLRGTRVAVEGVPNWLLMLGDEMVTAASAATIQLKDGSRVILAAASRLRVENLNGKTALRLVEGGMAVRSVENTSVQFFSQNSPVAVWPGVEVTVSAAGGPRAAGRPVTPPPPGVPPAASNR